MDFFFQYLPALLARHLLEIRNPAKQKVLFVPKEVFTKTVGLWLGKVC